MKPRIARGFTLPELILVTVIAGVILVVLSVLIETVVRSQSISLTDDVVANGASVAGISIRRALDTASVVQTPAVGSAPTPDLLVWANVNWDNGRPLDPALPISFQYFCTRAVGTETRMILRRNDNYAGAWPMTPFACSDAGPDGTAYVTLTGGAPGLTATTTFTRLNRGQVQVHYQIQLAASQGHPAQSATHDTAMGINSPL